MEPENAELFRLIESSHEPDVIRYQQVDQILRRTDGSILIVWKSRKWILTDLELMRRFGFEWLKNATNKLNTPKI